MTDPDEAAFLDQIGDSPDDDTTRLVYADWLDEHGFPERAHVIRVGVRVPKRRTFAVGARAEVAYVTGRQDIGAGPVWGRTVAVTLAPSIAGVAWTTYKGLVAAANCSWATWLAEGESLLASNWCPEVVLTELPNVQRGSYAIIPGRQNAHRVLDGENPVDVVLRAEWPAVKRWLYPKAIKAQDYTRGAFAPQIGDVVKLIDGSTGVLMSEIGTDGYAVVRPTGGNK